MREAFLGVDLGTSSVKAVLVDRFGVELSSAQIRYEVDRPVADWAEQDPEMWWRATAQAVRKAVGRTHYSLLSVGLSGQMHGLVIVGRDGSPLRPAIIWSDARSTQQVEAWHSAIDSATVEAISGFTTAIGMLGVSLTWVRDMEPHVYEAAYAVMLPKDYIRFRLTGVIATEPTDASGSLLYDIRGGHASTWLMQAVGLRTDLFPPVVPTLSIVGGVSWIASKATGIVAGTPVAAGGSDQTMAAIALGLDDPTRAAVAISSGGTVFKRTARPLDPALGLHVMPHPAPGQWLAMGVVLSAGLSLDWLTRKLFAMDPTPQKLSALMETAREVPPGAEGLLFSSQLGGVRTPRVDDTVRGSLIGLGFQHGQEHVTRALVEGVCIALVQSLTSMSDADEPVDELVISGGGARFALWRQTLSDVAELPVRVSSDIEHSALGAAFASAMAAGIDFEADLSNRISDIVYPNAANSALYRTISRDLAAAEHALARRKDSEQMTLTSHTSLDGEALR